MAKKIILDVDTGSDDAVAIMAAILSEDIDLVALCTVWGNLDIDHTTDNTLRLVEAMGKGDKIPVYKGCHTAMCKYLYDDRLEDRKNLDGSGARVARDENGNPIHMHEPELDLPAPTIKEQAMPATLFYIDYLRNATEKLTLVPVGPRTNLGHALRIAPDIVKNIEEIVIMGGGDKVGNVTGCAEANIWHDPEAAEIVANCGARVVWVPLDATHSACLTKDDCERFRALGTFAGNFAADLTAHRIVVHNATQPLEIPDAAAVHDALCICYLIDPTVLDDLRPVHISVSFGDWGDGETIVDRREGHIEPNGYFAFHGDRVKFANILCDVFKKK